jgi:hypothetical protein
MLDRSSTSGHHGLTRIYPNHALYLPLHYVLFYPAGGRGYHRALQLTGTTNTGENRTRTSMSARMFYCFHLHTRAAQFETFHCGGLLFQQFLVDAWASAESMDLDFLWFSQKKLRAD